MRPVFRFLPDIVERAESLDPASDKTAAVVSKAVPGGFVKDLLAGTWLGHPLRPVITGVPIGAWVAAGFLDVFGGEESRPAARKRIGMGTLAAVPTAAARLAGWGDNGCPAAKRV